MTPDTEPVSRTDRWVVRAVSVTRGPGFHSMIPMIRMRLDLGPLEECPTTRLPGLADALLDRLPGLADHECSESHAGGFLKRMAEGTWLGHVVEHCALEVQHMAGCSVTRGKTRSAKGLPGTYDVMIGYEDEAVGLAALRVALGLVDSLLPAELAGVGGLDLLPDMPRDWAGAMAALRDLAAARLLGPTSAALVAEAARRGIPVTRMDGASLIRLGHGAAQRRICASVTDATPVTATDIADDKAATKAILSAVGLPVPRGEVVTTAEEAIAAARRIGGPVVTKPCDGNHGRGITVGLTTEDGIRWGFAQAAAQCPDVVVEQVLPGDDHRILVIGGEVVAVARRIPAQVTGDGRSTITTLVDQTNRDPRRGVGHENVLTRITIDDCVLNHLQKQGLTPDSIPAKGQTVTLRPTANLSTGGTAADMTDVIHPDNALIARRAALAVGLDVAGVDFLTPDISRPVSETGGGIVEVNAGPGFRMHLRPSEGQPRNVAAPVIDRLFPDGADGRIPIFAITGTNGKSTTGWMLAHILREAGFRVGQTSTAGIHIGGERVASGDCAGPASARIVLADPTVEAAILECARGGILREGLAFDRASLGAVLNIAADHLGLGGIDTLAELAEVKGVVVEAVAPDGWSVLNADDPLTLDMRHYSGGNLCLFSLTARQDWPPELAAHIAAGGRALTCDPAHPGAPILLHDRGTTARLMEAAEIPATWGGTADFNIANAMAAAAMAHCHGIPLPAIRKAMASFRQDFDTAPGRMNLHQARGVRVLVDYAHNPHGLAALARVLDRQRGSGRLIGVVGVAGDRRDADMAELGALAGRVFDSLILKEDADPRGRARGEVAAILLDAAQSAGMPADRIRCVLPEPDAIACGLAQANQGDMVVITAEDITLAWETVRRWQGPSATGAERQAV